jgi:hypothetical protein
MPLAAWSICGGVLIKAALPIDGRVESYVVLRHLRKSNTANELTGECIWQMGCLYNTGAVTPLQGDLRMKTLSSSRVSIWSTNYRSMVVLAAFMVLALSSICSAQMQQVGLDSTIAKVRADAQADRVTIITASMNFSEKESSAFWPIYRKYEYERAKLDDRRVAVIKDYTGKYPTLSEADAKAMAETMIDCDLKIAELKKSYYKKLNTVLPALTVTKFFQLEHRIDLLMDMKVESALPPLAGVQQADQEAQVER